jgi:hypothetical protein
MSGKMEYENEARNKRLREYESESARIMPGETRNYENTRARARE